MNSPEGDRHSGNKVWLASLTSFQVWVWAEGRWYRLSLALLWNVIFLLDQQSVRLLAPSLPNPQHSLALPKCCYSSSAISLFSRCRVPRLHGSQSRTCSSMTSEIACAVLLRQPASASPSSRFTQAGHAGHVHTQQSQKRICCEGAPTTLTSHPQPSLQDLARASPSGQSRGSEWEWEYLGTGALSGTAYTAFSTPILAGKRESQDHLARRYLLICCANNHPHNTIEFTVPQRGSSAESPTEVPHKHICDPLPAQLSPRATSGLCTSLWEKSRRLPRADPVSGSGTFCNPRLPEPTRRSRAKGQEAGRFPPKTCAHTGSGPFSLPPPLSFLPVPAPEPPAPPAPPVPSISSVRKEETSF